MYKSLLPHQAAAGYTMAAAKACLSQKPVAAWDLQDALQSAVIKTVTGSSSGVPTTNSITTAHVSAAGPDTQHQQQEQQVAWMCLSRRKLVGCDLLSAAPGQVVTTPFVELEVQMDAGSTDVLLLVHAAGRWTPLGSSLLRQLGLSPQYMQLGIDRFSSWPHQHAWWLTGSMFSAVCCRLWAHLKRSSHLTVHVLGLPSCNLAVVGSYFLLCNFLPACLCTSNCTPVPQH